MPRYKLAIFDFDGTLADSFPWFIGAVNDAAARFGFRGVADCRPRASTPSACSPASRRPCATWRCRG
jgi:phosphoglycolate phosphatase-like HAD superfamily hydrolase